MMELTFCIVLIPPTVQFPASLFAHAVCNSSFTALVLFTKINYACEA